MQYQTALAMQSVISVLEKRRLKRGLSVVHLDLKWLQQTVTNPCDALLTWRSIPRRQPEPCIPAAVSNATSNTPGSADLGYCHTLAIASTWLSHNRLV